MLVTTGDDNPPPGRIGRALARLADWSERAPARVSVAAMVAAGVLLLALLPLARALDWRTDRHRPMYDDIERMHTLQKALIKQTGAPVALTLQPGERTTQAGTSFRTSPGVLLVVETDDQGYCVRAEDQYGEVSDWQCSDAADVEAPVTFRDYPGATG